MAFASFQNLTVAVLYGNFMKIEGKKVVGMLGSIVDELLVHKKRNWILKYTSSLRDDNVDLSIKNQTFAYMAKHNLADVYNAPDSSNYDNEYLEPTKTVSTDSLQIGHFLAKPKNSEESDLSAFLLENINLLFYILIGYLFIIASNFIAIKFSNFDQLNRLSFKFALMILFFDIFIFFNLNILTNFIKTTKVVIKTDDFLNSNEKILSSKKSIYFLFNSEDIFIRAPKNNFLNKLYNKKVNEEKKFLRMPAKPTKESNEQIQKMFNNICEYFYLLKRSNMLILLGMASMKVSNIDDYFLYLNNEYYNEFLKVYFVRRSLNKNLKRQLFQSSQQYFETGIYINYYFKWGNAFSSFSKNPRIYTDLQEYINDYSLTSDFEFENFRTIFICFISNLIFIFLIYIKMNYRKVFRLIKKNCKF